MRIIKRRINSQRNSVVGDGMKLASLDWTNWREDRSFGSFYLHVRMDGEPDKKLDETWHRVYPTSIPGCTCTRVAVYDGIPFWLHEVADETKPTNHGTKNT